MLREGRIRVSPASYYNHRDHIAAVRDSETERPFIIPTYRQRLRGESSFEFQGRPVYFGGRDFEIPIAVDDYYLYSLCNVIYHRLPTDFEADSALVITNPRMFEQRLVSTFLATAPTYDALVGDVTYYDRYLDFRKVTEPPMAKHFRYSYQKERRIAFRPRSADKVGLKPVFLKIGDMRDYAQLVTLSN